MRRPGIVRGWVGGSALALVMAGAATAGQATGPPPKPPAAADRAAAARVGTIAGRYKATILDAGEAALDLVQEALDRREVEVDGDHLIEAALDPDTSDLAAIRERGFIRMGVAPDPLLIAYDGERAIGVAMELARELETYLAENRDAAGTPTVTVPMPIPRKRIPDALEDGMADFTPLVVTDARDERFDFTQPLLTDVNDVVVLGPEAPDVSTIDDLTRVPIYVQEGGRYSENLKELNAVRTDEGQEPLKVRYVDERLDDYDLIELAAIGLIPATVMSGFKAEFWSRIYTTVDVRQDMELTKDGRIAWAVRADNPELRKTLDGFAEKVKQGTLIGNILLKRYFGSTEWIENIDDTEARQRIDEVEPVIRKYSEMFEFEPDLVLAQAYQESQLDQSKRSHVGAIGVMQVMPKTAADPVVGIPDVTGLHANVHAGVKYLRWVRDTYFSEPGIDPLDQTLFSFAAYNAGPGGVNRARKRAAKMGLDPDVWFENVEVAITKAVSREPAVYVRNIFKYYVSYRLLRELEQEREEAREEVAVVQEEVEDLPMDEKLEALEEAEIVVDEVLEPDVQAGMANEAIPEVAGRAAEGGPAAERRANDASTGASEDSEDVLEARVDDEKAQKIR